MAISKRDRERFKVQKDDSGGMYGECPVCGRWVVSDTRELVVEALNGHMARHEPDPAR